MPSFPVKHITHNMRGAPVIAGNAPGAIIAALDALLVTGFAQVTALSVLVQDGIATATLNAGDTFAEYCVVLVSGATLEALNGEQRVLSATNTSITWATSAPNGTATGTITIKIAPAGWEKVYNASNKAVYRSTDPQSAKHVLYVDDSSGLFARVRGFESMSDINTGTGPFPTDAMMNGGGYWHKSTAANATAIPYAIAADSRMVLHALSAGASGGVNLVAAGVRGFGDTVPLNPAGDAFSTVLSCAWNSNANSIDVGALSGSSSDSSVGAGISVAPRGWQGLGSAVLQRPVPMTGIIGALSGNADFLGAAPSVIDGQVKTSAMWLKDQGANNPPRAMIPGVHYIPHSNALVMFAHLSTHNGAGPLLGRRLLAVHVGPQATSATGVVLIDLTGPWR